MEATAWAPVLLAPIIGSFLGVIIRRWPDWRAIVFGRSRCTNCGTRLTPIELVPLASWALQQGRCRHCRERVLVFYPAVELTAMAVAMTAAWYMPGRVWVACGFGWTLMTLAWIDAERLLLPDEMTLPLLVAGLADTFATSPEDLTDRAAAASLGYLTLAALARAYRAVRGQDGLGLGDAKLFAAVGAWVGTVVLPWVAVAAALAGLAVGALAWSRDRTMRRDSAIPFGPFLAAAGWWLWLVTTN